MSQIYARFLFLEKDLRIVSPPHFVYDFSRKSAAWKVSKYGISSGLFFPALGLNPSGGKYGLDTERCGVSLPIQSKCGKIRTRKNSVFGEFSLSEGYLCYILLTDQISLSGCRYFLRYWAILFVNQGVTS